MAFGGALALFHSGPLWWGRGLTDPPKRFQIAVELSGLLMGVKCKAMPKRHRGTSHGASGFMPSHGDADHTTPDVSCDYSLDKETIKDNT